MQEMPEKIIKKLKKLTDEQIYTLIRESRKELKNRLNAILSKKKTSTHEYVMVFGVVESIDNIKKRQFIGLDVYKPYPHWKYKLKDLVIPVGYKRDLTPLLNKKEYYKTYGNLLKAELPKVGDKVRIRVRLSKDGFKQEDIDNAKIVEVIKN
jgi:hypothetical protein